MKKTTKNGNRQKRIQLSRGVGLAAYALMGVLSQSAQAQTTGFNQTGAGPYDYNNTSNWVGGNVNGIFDPSLTLLAAQTLTFGTNTTLSTPLSFRYSGGVNETLRADGTGPYTLTLGGDILVQTAGNQTITFGSSTANQVLNVNLGGGVRTFTVYGGGNGGNFGRTLDFRNTVSNGGVIASGGGSGGGLIRFSAASNTLSSLTVAGAEVSFNGAAVTASNTVGTITGALTSTQGPGSVAITTAATRHSLVQAGTFARTAGSTLLFRGTNLGVNTIASGTVNSSNVEFITGPTLSGAGGLAGSTTVSILRGVFADTNSAGTGFGSTGGLVTYDSTYGLRLLSNAEYKTSIGDGQTQLDNVRISNSSGAIATTTLTSDTVINSLSLSVSGAPGNQGITIAGNPGTKLTLSSGVLYADQNVSSNPVVSDAMTLNVPILDFNGQEGIILVNTRMNASGGTSNGALTINSTITNATGLTIGDGVSTNGGGYVFLGGTAANTYTGNTTVNGASVRLGKTPLNTFGDMVLNFGAIFNSGNQMADTANLTINGGIFYLNATSNSGSATSDTINNLTMTNGNISPGSGNANTLTLLGNANLSGGSVTSTTNAKFNVAGVTNLSGGVISQGRSTTGAYTGKTTLSGAVNITNTAQGTAPYTPITIAAGAAGTVGGQVELNGDLTFTGNSNTNTTTIAAPTGVGPQGVLALNGVRTFNIGNGSANVDLTVEAGVVDGTLAGGLNKTGTGTLALNGVNTYTSGTTVNAGTLLVNGSIGAVTVNSSGVLGGTGGTVGAVTVNSGGYLAPGASIGTLTAASTDLQSGSILRLEINTGAATTDLLNVTGAFNLASGATLDLALIGTDTLLTLGTQFTLVDYGTWNGTTFAGYADGAIFNLGLNTFQIDYDFGGGTLMNLTTVAVPEPSTYALVGLGLGALWFLRRRQNRASKEG